MCEDGDELSAEDCKILFQFDVKLTEFKVALVCRWNDGSFEEF